MSEAKRRQRLRSHVAQNPNNVRFEDMRGLLEAYGFELKRTKGSHHAFVGYAGDDKMTIVIPFRKPLHEIYVRKTLALLDRIDRLNSAGTFPVDGDDDDA